MGKPHVGGEAGRDGLLVQRVEVFGDGGYGASCGDVVAEHAVELAAGKVDRPIQGHQIRAARGVVSCGLPFCDEVEVRGVLAAEPLQAVAHLCGNWREAIDGVLQYIDEVKPPLGDILRTRDQFAARWFGTVALLCCVRGRQPAVGRSPRERGMFVPMFGFDCQCWGRGAGVWCAPARVYGYLAHW